MGMFIKIVGKGCVVEVKEGLCKYDGRSLLKLLNHVNKYAKMDNKVHRHIILDFQKPPNMDLLINTYFAR